MSDEKLVLLRAYGGKPLVRQVLKDDNGYGGVHVCEVGNPDRDIGWPKEYVFIYDEILISKLRSAHESGSDELEDYWDEAKPYLMSFVHPR